jgi:hypothetical protein
VLAAAMVAALATVSRRATAPGVAKGSAALMPMAWRLADMATKTKSLVYVGNCVRWPRYDVDRHGGLNDMIRQAIEVSRATFLKYVDTADLHELEHQLGYERHPRRGLTMASDWHVSYHRSRLHGRTVYYFRQSAIEYVFGHAL